MEKRNQIATSEKMKQDSEYSELLKMPQWTARRELIIKRDGGRCLNCGSYNNLQVHHRQYHQHASSGFFKKPWEYKDKYLITLCFDCHHAGHKYFKIPVFNV